MVELVWGGLPVDISAYVTFVNTVVRPFHKSHAMNNILKLLKLSFLNVINDHH